MVSDPIRVALIVAPAEDVSRLAAALGEDFHVDAVSLRRAIGERSSANVIHHDTSTKVDLFIVGRSPIDRTQMDRRQRVRIATDPEAWIYVYTPEDILLQRLAWFRLGNEVSDRQWRDVLGIILTQQGRLDATYLKQGAEALGVSDLLQWALGHARGES